MPFYHSKFDIKLSTTDRDYKKYCMLKFTYLKPYTFIENKETCRLCCSFQTQIKNLYRYHGNMSSLLGEVNHYRYPGNMSSLLGEVNNYRYPGNMSSLLGEVNN